MPRGSFSRTVARAAASGGSRSYRARRPVAWYALLVLIVVGGVVLVGYSRNEHLHPPKAAALPPTRDANWNVAFAIDICGKVQPPLATSSNVDKVGIRTFGNGLINITPAIAKNPANYEGKKATLANFVDHYSGLLVTSETIITPPYTRSFVNGESCIGPLKGKSFVTTKVWSSPSAKGVVYKGDPTKIHLENRQMITIAFLPKGTPVPEPPSKKSLPAS